MPTPGEVAPTQPLSHLTGRVTHRYHQSANDLAGLCGNDLVPKLTYIQMPARRDSVRLPGPVFKPDTGVISPGDRSATWTGTLEYCQEVCCHSGGVDQVQMVNWGVLLRSVPRVI